MRGWAVSALAAIGCYAPSVPSGAPCDPAAPSCPRGQRCAEVGGTFVCTPGSGVPTESDGDGDGVLDDADNCAAIANPGQSNEDGDELGDACDPCPPIAETAPIDSDADGVSDACDPRPKQPGDRIALFEGFATGIPATWSRGGVWVATNGTSSIDTDDAATLSVVRPISSHHSITAAVAIESIPANTDASAGVVDGYDDLGGLGIYCHLKVFDGGTQPMVLNVLDSNGTGSVRVPFEMVAGTSYTVKLRRDDGTFTCAGQTGARSVTTPVLANTPPGLHVGVRASNVRLRFAWLLVVDNP